jgi:hypothetical protein
MRFNINYIKKLQKLGTNFEFTKNGQTFIEYIWDQILEFFNKNKMIRSQQIEFLKNSQFIYLLNYVDKHNLVKHNIHVKQYYYLQTNELEDIACNVLKRSLDFNTYNILSNMNKKQRIY